MAKVRKFVAYRRLERPYTRHSKYRAKSYVRGSPNIKIVRFDMGNLKKEFSYTVKLLSKKEEFEILKLVLDKFLWIGFIIMGYGLYIMAVTGDVETIPKGLAYMAVGTIVLLLFTFLLVKEYEFIK